jgi:hypothetical protein
MATTPVPTKADIQAAKAALTEQLATLDAAIQTAHEVHEAATAQDESAAASLARTRRGLAALNGRGAELNGSIKKAELAAAIQSLDSAESGAIDISQFLKLSEVERERSFILRAIATAAELIIPENIELKLTTEEAALLAEAAKIEAHCAKRDFTLRIKMADAVSQEGRIVINNDNTVSGELRKRASELRLQAGATREQITKIQRERAGKAAKGAQ